MCRLILLLVGLGHVVAGTLSPCCGAQTASPPNIVLIISDDHAWTDYGFMGHPHLQTPHLNKLANESLVFRRGYVPSSLCCPSLATILTGRYPHQHRITSNDPPLIPGLAGKDFQSSEAFLKGRQRMNEHMNAVPTLPRLLASKGYRSLQTGKWWQGDFKQGGFTDGMSRGQRHGDEGLDIGRKTMEPINRFLDDCAQTKTPFFVWYAPMMPHDPHTPPDRILNRYKPLTSSIHQAKYWAMIEWFDETIGSLRKSLEERNLSDNTIIVYVADNGWIQDPNKPRYAAKSKQSPYDGGIRTPILVHWPQHIQPKVSESLAQSIDIVPTLLAATDISRDIDPALSSLPGINLLDDSATSSRSRIAGACFTHNAIDLDRPNRNVRWRWLIDQQWKLIVPDPQNEPNQVVELYNLEADPSEENNLATSQSDRVQQLRQGLDDWWTP